MAAGGKDARGFLRSKISHSSIGELLFSQVESVALWLVGGLPGLPGFALRWAVLKLLLKRLGGFCWVQPGVTIVQADRLQIGRHFGCNTGTYINAIGGITMGDYVLIGSNVTISSGMHPIDGPEPPVFARPSVGKPIRIEDDVWIAAGVVVLPGVTLRKGTVVGANSVVTKDTEEFSVYGGAPARKIGSRLQDTTSQGAASASSSRIE
jgi:acetyltransferase-like isoleucine patch superfamily enzyme